MTKRLNQLISEKKGPAIVHNNVMSALQTEFDKMKLKHCRIEHVTSSVQITEAFRVGYDEIDWGHKGSII